MDGKTIPAVCAVAAATPLDELLLSLAAGHILPGPARTALGLLAAAGAGYWLHRRGTP